MNAVAPLTPSRFLSLAVALLLVGCGDSNDDTALASRASTGPNELLKVSARPLQRSARPIVADPAQAGISQVAIESTAEVTAADRQAAKLAPDVDGWDSERLNELAFQRLKALTPPVGEIDFANLLADGFHSSALVPTTVEVSSLAGEIQIIEGLTFEASTQTLAQDLQQLRNHASGDSDSNPVIRFKPVRVNLDQADGSRFSTEVLVEVEATQADGTVLQVDAVWRCSWHNSDPLTLTQIEVTAFREVQAPRPLFDDVTLSAFAGTTSFAEQMMHGIGYWAERVTRVDDFHLTGHHGIAVGDVNGDGLEDVYACDGGGLPNRLYVQLADGTVIDRSAEAQVDFLEDSRSALIVDLDNDGDQDLVVATVALVIFAENDGTGRFTLKGGHPGSPGPYSMAAADYDNDGDLDIYVTSYGKGRDAASGAQDFEVLSPVPYNDANNGGRNILLANHGAFRFSDVTKAAGLDANNERWTFAAAWEDYDQDGDADLYVVNDFGRNCLYQNDAGTFQDIAAEAGVEDMAGGMSAAWGDADGDGKMDIYVGNMFSAAGNRVTYQRKFGASRKTDDASAIQRMARGNSLFQQGEDGRFQDVSEPAGVTMGRWAWSSGFADLNNDGWEDLVVANGYISNPKTDDL
ncbi:MAG: hypothetical protein ACI9R3_000051 [Verrucomicrobiales bacterium]